MLKGVSVKGKKKSRGGYMGLRCWDGENLIENMILKQSPEDDLGLHKATEVWVALPLHQEDGPLKGCFLEQSCTPNELSSIVKLKGSSSFSHY